MGEGNGLKRTLVSRSGSGQTTTYTYDGQGTLVKKTEGGTTTVYVAGLYENAGGAVTKYYLFDGERIAMRTNGGVSYLLQDHLGSTTATVGATSSSQTYFPFGKTRSTTSVSTDKRFTGHQQEGSLYFMQARFYDPAIGRFLQPDTIVPDPSNPQSLNRYSYVLNNPQRYTDPTGHCAICDSAGGVVGNVVDATGDLAVDLKDEGIRYGPLATCLAPNPACAAAVVCAATSCADDVADIGVDCWQSELCRTISVSVGVTACTAAWVGSAAAACTAAGLAALSYEDAADCAGGDGAGCVNVGIAVGIEVASYGAGHGLRGVVWREGRIAYRPHELKPGGILKNWRFAPFGNTRSHIPHYHRPPFHEVASNRQFKRLLGIHRPFWRSAGDPWWKLRFTGF